MNNSDKVLIKKIEDATLFLSKYVSSNAKLAIILGTGSGSFANSIEIEQSIHYRDIPHFLHTTVESHDGKLIIGKIGDIELVALQGRFHYYEGYSMVDITFPIRVLKKLGIQALILTNAAGGLHPDFEAGDIICIRDHINLFPAHPLRGISNPELGPRFPDMLDAYSKSLRTKMLEAFRNNNLTFKEGVYAGLQGPSLETPAEYNYLRTIGADLVGMSTVPEVIVARQCDIEIVALSIVSNVCFPLARITKTTVEEVIAVVKSREESLKKVLLDFILLIMQ